MNRSLRTYKKYLEGRSVHAHTYMPVSCHVITLNTLQGKIKRHRFRGVTGSHLSTLHSGKTALVTGLSIIFSPKT